MPIVCDMSSDILSRPVDVSKYGVIFAGAQKNMAPAGLTVVIIKEELAGHELPFTPLMMNYKTMIDKDSMYNTPPCWCIYMLGRHPGLGGGAGGPGWDGEACAPCAPPCCTTPWTAPGCSTATRRRVPAPG